MAEAEMKGKVSLEPKVVISTKNVKDSCASTYSNEPASITRRDRITITVTVKPQYAVHDMLNEELVRAAFPDGTPVIPDLWDIHVEQSHPVPSKVKGKTAFVGWSTVQWNGKSLKDIGLPELIRWVGQDSKKFYEAQRKFVANSNDIASKLNLCDICNHPKPEVCICSPGCRLTMPKIDETCPEGYCGRCEAHHNEDESIFEFQDSDSESHPSDEDLYDDQVGTKFVSALLPRYYRAKKWWQKKSVYWTENIEDQCIDIALNRLDWLETSPWVCWTNWVPTDWLQQDWMKNVIWMSHEQEIRARIRRSYLNHIILCLAICFVSLYISWYLLVILVIPMSGISGVVNFEKNKLYGEVSSQNDAMPAIFKMYRDKHVKWITSCCVAIAGLYAVAQVWKAFKVVPAPQGNISPTTTKEIDERDSEVSPWAGTIVSPMPCSKQAQTTTVDQLEKLVESNLCHMTIRREVEGGVKLNHCDAFFPKSNVALIPNHIWKADDVKAKFVRHDPKQIGGNFESYLYRKHSVSIPDTDFSLVWIPNGGDWKDLTTYFPGDRFASVPGRLVYKDENGLFKKSKLNMLSGHVQTKAAEFFGAHYQLSFKTFDGLCMAPVITETKGPLIGGFHLGGRADSTQGCCGLLTQMQFNLAFEELSKKEGVLLSKSSGTVPIQMYDVQYFQGTSIHPKSPINYLPHDTNCKYYGQVTGRSSYHSTVETSVLSKHVEEICGVPQKWGPPKFRTGYPWQASLRHSAKPSCGIEGSLLVKASKDYEGVILSALDNLPKLKSRVRPLDEMETVCGIDGLRFIDKMPPSTSVGFPLGGPKSGFLKPGNLEDYPSHQCPMILDQRFWDAAQDAEQTYLRGERAYPIFKACLKDEPTSLDKNKVRVFQGATIALQLIVRKYFLPVARILSVLPLLSECAVGVNAQGPEWDQLARHVKKYGADRILAGDYSKYDLRMPAQVMFCAFRILINIAKHCGYSEEHVIIMEGIATDICYPLMAYNGDLIQHFGSNPSGQNLTVYINSIVNSLLFRCAFFHIVGNRTNKSFRSACSLITYGDDAKSSVHRDFPEFNHISVAAFLAERDMVFTMPDKESIPTAYMHDEDADLLKRKNISCPETGMIMGALQEDSIFKSLHATLHSKALTKEQQAMANIDGALREWFSHGRHTYELRREQMKRVAQAADVAHGCHLLDQTYDEALSNWKEKYKVE
jgi:hypothetical protein